MENPSRTPRDNRIGLPGRPLRIELAGPLRNPVARHELLPRETGTSN